MAKPASVVVSTALSVVLAVSMVVVRGCRTTGDARRPARIRTTRIAGGLLLGYNPWKAGARLKTPAFTLFRPYCP